MVPIGALADVREVNGPFILTRYNMYQAAVADFQYLLCPGAMKSADLEPFHEGLQLVGHVRKVLRGPGNLLGGGR